MNSAYVELDGLPGTMFKETPAGLWIRQGTDEHPARAWTLSSDVVEVISKAATYGFTCLIRHKSPSPASRGSGGVEYIGFSRTAAERWVFVLDQFSCPSKVRRRWAVTSGCIGGRIEHTSAQLAEESSVRILAPGEAA